MRVGKFLILFLFFNAAHPIYLTQATQITREFREPVIRRKVAITRTRSRATRRAVVDVDDGAFGGGARRTEAERILDGLIDAPASGRPSEMRTAADHDGLVGPPIVRPD